MYYQRAVVRVVIAVGAVGVRRVHWQLRNQSETLPQYVGYGRIVRVGVVAVKAENAPREHIHCVLGRLFHYYVAHEIAGQGAEVGKYCAKAFKLACRGQFSE